MTYLKVDIGGREGKLTCTHSSCGFAAKTIQHSHTNPASYASYKFHGLFNKGSQGEKENISTSIQLLQILQCEQRGGL